MQRFVPIALLLLAAVVLLRNAWLSDDAYISYRTIEHLLGGYGLRWNVDERVQVFTHPFWLFLLSGCRVLLRDMWLTALTVSFVLSLACFILVARVARGGATLLALVALLCSRSFVDYSSSGLENPLTHLLLLLFAGFFWNGRLASARRLAALSLLAGLLAFNRLDCALLVLPALIYVAWPLRRAAVGPLLLGFLPLIGWLVFATVYFGFPFPNTAYAKLAAGIPAGDLFAQGLRYGVSCLIFDPSGMVFLIGVLVAAALRHGREDLAWLGGVVVYLLYTLRIGGDFMAGRFFAASILMAAAWIAWRPPALPRPARVWPTLAGILFLAALAWRDSPLRSGDQQWRGLDWEDQIDSRGVSDERAVYFEATNPLQWRSGREMPHHEWADWSRQQRDRGFRGAVTLRSAGFHGYYLGPEAHAFDHFALVDAFLARQPYQGGPWRPGHFQRDIPEEYRESVRTGHNLMTFPKERQLYDDLVLLTRAPLRAPGRWAAIWRQNLASLEH